MSDHDVPEFDEFDADFDEFESRPTDAAEDGSIWFATELPPEDPTEHTEYEVEEQTGEQFPEPASDVEQISATSDEGGAHQHGRSPRPTALVENGHNGHKGHGSGMRPWSTAGARSQSRRKAPASRSAVANPTGEFEQMTALAAAAARTKKRSTVGQLVAAMVPLAFQPESRHRQVLQPIIPVLVQGAAGLALVMFDEGVQQLVTLMPAILTQTSAHLGTLAARGQPVDRYVAASALDEFTAAAIEQGSQDVPNRRSNPFTLWDDDDEDEYDER